MVEWQLPKLHTRVRFPSPAFLSQRRTKAYAADTAAATTSRFSAKEFPEGLEKFVRELSSFFSEVVQLLRELHLIAAVDFTSGGRNFVRGQIKFVGGASRFAASSREMI